MIPEQMPSVNPDLAFPIARSDLNQLAFDTLDLIVRSASLQVSSKT